MLENVFYPKAISFPSPLVSHEIVDDLRVAFSSSYFSSLCLGHANWSVNSEQWAASMEENVFQSLGQCIGSKPSLQGGV